MRPIATTLYLDIEKDVEVTVNARDVTVKGPRGELRRNFKHACLDIQKIDGEEGSNGRLRFDLWFGKKKAIASVRTCLSHVKNMMIGVTRGFRYKMRFVYNHFPINVTIENGNHVEIRNFLGEKRVRVIDAFGDTQIVRSKDVKDEIVLEGNDVEAVSGTCASIHDACLVKRKDIRKFLDGMYVSEKGAIPPPEDD